MVRIIAFLGCDLTSLSPYMLGSEVNQITTSRPTMAFISTFSKRVSYEAIEQGSSSAMRGHRERCCMEGGVWV